MTGLRLLGKVFVVEDMIQAEAVIPCAAGTVAEFQIGVGGVCSAADSALVAITTFAFLFLLLADSRFELDRLVTGLMAGSVSAPCQFTGNVVPKKYKEVQQGHNGQKSKQGIGEQITDDCDGKDSSVSPCQPLDFYGDEEEQQELSIRIQHGEGKEQGHVHVVYTGDMDVHTENQTCDDAYEQGEGNTGKIVQIEFCGTPFPFQRGSNHIIQV